ncbi:hypothetical protein MTO96_024010 [Rhipicephalus appendiculatus]
MGEGELSVSRDHGRGVRVSSICASPPPLSSPVSSGMAEKETFSSSLSGTKVFGAHGRSDAAEWHALLFVWRAAGAGSLSLCKPCVRVSRRDPVAAQWSLCGWWPPSIERRVVATPLPEGVPRRPKFRAPLRPGHIAPISRA